MDRRTFLSTAPAAASVFAVGFGLPRLAAAEVMTVGKCKFIQYKTWTNNENWTATLQSLSRQVETNWIGVDVPITVIDPDFHHVGPGGARDDKWIQFQAWNGKRVGSLCHSHLHLNNVSFDFGHYNPDGSYSHKSGEITFIAWDGSHWAARIDPVGVPGHNESIPLEFTLRKA